MFCNLFASGLDWVFVVVVVRCDAFFQCWKNEKRLAKSQPPGDGTIWQEGDDLLVSVWGKFVTTPALSMAHCFWIIALSTMLWVCCGGVKRIFFWELRIKNVSLQTKLLVDITGWLVKFFLWPWVTQLHILKKKMEWFHCISTKNMLQPTEYTLIAGVTLIDFRFRKIKNTEQISTECYGNRLTLVEMY